MNTLSGPQFMEAPQPVDDDFIDLRQLFRTVMLRKWSILGLALVIALLTALVVFSMQPIYQAKVSLVLESREANVVSVEKVYSMGYLDYDYFQTQYEILKSRNLAERVVKRLALHKHAAFLPKEEDEPLFSFDLKSLLPAGNREPPVQLTPEEKEAAAIKSVTNAVAASLQVSPVEYSYLVYVEYESPDPRLAALIVNTLAEEYINSDLENRRTGTIEATGWLTERLTTLKQNLRASEEALQEFRDREQLVDVEGVTSLGGQELRDLSNRLEEARRARIEAQNIKEEVQGMSDASTEELMTVPAVVKHPLIADLEREQSGAERKVAELAKRYGVKHPKMIAARSGLDTANANAAQEVRKVVSGISREYELARLTEQELLARWERRKSEVQDFNRKEFELLELQREVDTNRQLYDIFFKRIKETSETGGFERPHARILDAAQVPTGAVKPNKRMSITLALILGLMLSAGLAVLLDLLENTVRGPEDVENKLGATLLGSLPQVKTDKEGGFPQFWDDQNTQYAEALRTIRTGVVLSGLDNPARVIVVTSSLPGEGKSTVALNLGSAMAQMEQTLVLGADLRRPSLAKRCDMAPNHKGLSHYVAGTAELDDCIEYLEASNLYVMPAGLIPPNPLEMISSRKFVAALETLKERFERIIIDSAPLQAVSDALMLASYADSVIYLIKADSTHARLAKKGLDSIRASNGPLTGVVINAVNMDKASKYYGGQYYQYSNYYRSEESEA